jgi:hypothetical protein
MTKEFKRIESRLRKEYVWRAKRYSESELGIRSRGNNCFNEANARRLCDDLEAQYEALGGDCAELRRQAFATVEPVSAWDTKAAR